MRTPRERAHAATRTRVHHLHRTARETKRHRVDGALSRPVHDLVELRDDVLCARVAPSRVKSPPAPPPPPPRSARSASPAAGFACVNTLFRLPPARRGATGVTRGNNSRRHRAGPSLRSSACGRTGLVDAARAAAAQASRAGPAAAPRARHCCGRARAPTRAATAACAPRITNITQCSGSFGLLSETDFLIARWPARKSRSCLSVAVCRFRGAGGACSVICVVCRTSGRRTAVGRCGACGCVRVWSGGAPPNPRAQMTPGVPTIVGRLSVRAASLALCDAVKCNRRCAGGAHGACRPRQFCGHRGVVPHGQRRARSGQCVRLLMRCDVM